MLTYEQFHDHLLRQDYVAEEGLSMAIYLAYSLRRPLFLEGEAGVGKTEVAKVLAGALGTELIRLQCYRGLESEMVLFEWNTLKQLLAIRLAEFEVHAGKSRDAQDLQKQLFSEEFLMERPLLRALRAKRPPVLLIDEVDRADEEFEAFLLEFLSDFQISIPEMGTVTAQERPYVILTSNRTRNVHDALRRRCLYYWIDYPEFHKELHIVQRKSLDLTPRLARQLCAFSQVAREREFDKLPGVSETLEWAQVLLHLGVADMADPRAPLTLGTLFKTNEDLSQARDQYTTMLQQAERAIAGLDRPE